MRVKVLKNDYNQHFVDTGERPQNFIRDAEPSERFTEYPKLERLIQLKDELTTARSHPAQHLKVDLTNFDLRSLGCAFDVILVDPPWSEYQDRSLGGGASEELAPWTLEQIRNLRVDLISENPSFCFIWAGATHLEDARAVLNAWGFRRCEDICWVKTNRRQRRANFRSAMLDNEDVILQRVKEHCLMGVKGAVRRSTDRHFIHANVDTDVILDEEPEEPGSTAKPLELYDLIDRFCLGRRKLELFGTDRNTRRGWVTLGRNLTVTVWDKAKYLAWTSDPPLPDSLAAAGGLPRPDFWGYPEVKDYRGGRYVGSSSEIETLRPKSPLRSATGPSGSATAAAAAAALSFSTGDPETAAASAALQRVVAAHNPERVGQAGSDASGASNVSSSSVGRGRGTFHHHRRFAPQQQSGQPPQARFDQGWG